MFYSARRLLVVLSALGVLLGCTSRRGPAVTATRAVAVTAEAAVTTPAQPGRLPSVLARLSFADPLGEAYQPQSVTFDESGRAYALCYHQGQLNDGPSALVPGGRFLLPSSRFLQGGVKLPTGGDSPRTP